MGTKMMKKIVKKADERMICKYDAWNAVLPNNSHRKRETESELHVDVNLSSELRACHCKEKSKILCFSIKCPEDTYSKLALISLESTMRKILLGAYPLEPNVSAGGLFKYHRIKCVVKCCAMHATLVLISCM